MAGFVYVLSLDQPIAHSQFYLGCTADFDRRLKNHCKGKGSHFTRAARERGIHLRIEVVVELPTYRDAYQLERRLKRWKNNRKAIAFLEKLNFLLYGY